MLLITQNKILSLIVLLLLIMGEAKADASAPPLLINFEPLDWQVYLPNVEEQLEANLLSLSLPGDKKGWQSHSVPSLVSDTAFWSLDGRLWYRLQFNATKVTQKQALGLMLGRVLEANSVWLNGQLLGKNGILDQKGSRMVSDVHSLRYYPIKAGIIKSKANVLLVEIQSLSTGYGIVSGPIGIAHSGPAWKYKAAAERPVLFAQSGLLVLQLISLVVGLLTLFALRRYDAEHFAFVSLFTLSLITFGIDSLLFYQSGLKSELVQRIGLVAGFAIVIPLIIYTRSLIGVRSSKSHTVLIATFVFVCFMLLLNTSLLFYWLIISIYLILLIIAIGQLFLVGFPVARNGDLAVSSVLVGVVIFIVSVVIYTISDPVGSWLRHDEVGMGLLMLSILVGYILRLMDMQNRLRDVSTKLVSVSEQERKHLARELHDGINQRLATTRLKLQMHESRTQDEQLESLSNELLLTMEEMDRLVQGLQPLNLEHHNLASAIELEVQSLETVEGLDIYVDIESMELPEELEQHLYRIFQESLHNALKHAQASVIKIKFARKRNKLLLSFCDNGNGFETVKKQKVRHGIGMISLRERVDLLGGILQIDSQKGKGTKIIVQVDMI